MCGLHNSKSLIELKSLVRMTKLFNNTRTSSCTAHAAFTHITFTARKVPTRQQTRSLTYSRTSTVPFPTRHNGLRSVLWVDEDGDDLKDEVDTAAAKLAFDHSNPFHDLEAHNCVVQFPVVSYSYDSQKEEILDAFLFYNDAAVLARTELDKAFASAGYTTHWPMVLQSRLDQYRGSLLMQYRLAFKLPRKEDPCILLKQLRVGGEEVAWSSENPTTGWGSTEWWYRFLFSLPKEQKYWEGGEEIPVHGGRIDVNLPD